MYKKIKKLTVVLFYKEGIFAEDRRLCLINQHQRCWRKQ